MNIKPKSVQEFALSLYQYMGDQAQHYLTLAETNPNDVTYAQHFADVVMRLQKTIEPYTKDPEEVCILVTAEDLIAHAELPENGNLLNMPGVWLLEELKAYVELQKKK